MYCLGQVIAYGSDVGGRHIGGHGLDLGPGAAHAFPEGFQGFYAFAVADEDDDAAEQIEYHGEVTMALADGNFINGNLLELMQFGFAKAALEVAGLDVLDGVPTDLEVFGHILDGHV